jgi:hypothetical protein
MHDTHPLIVGVYDEYNRTLERERQLTDRCQWVTSQATLDELERLVKPPPEDPDDDDDDRPRTERAYLLGLPIEVREGAEGIHLERTPESWKCVITIVGKPTSGWHERGCPHVDWSLAE